MAKNLMAERLADFQQEIIGKVDGDLFDLNEPDLSRRAVRDAFRAFKLDPQNPHHQRWLLFFLAHVVFGRRLPGRPKGKRTII
jgi:hypothetical protein